MRTKSCLALVVEGLAGRPVPEITDSEYDNPFVVTIVPGGEPRLVKAKVGTKQ